MTSPTSLFLIIAPVLLPLVFAISPTIRATGEWADCSGTAGICIDTNNYQCSTTTQTGLCPGGSSIRCCSSPNGVSYAACTAESGLCMRTSDCSGTSVTNKCPGPSGIACCTSAPSTCTLGSTTSCSTSVAEGLTSQLLAELIAMGVQLTSLAGDSRFVCNSPCVPYLQQAARDALAAATDSKGDFITLNHAYRSSAQQYLLYNWKNEGRCGISAAATPGRSNHEGGLGIDLSSYDYWKSALETNSWSWLSFDVVHFNYIGGGVQGVPAQNLEAFQRLWNRNNPTDIISEDGMYGSTTAARLSKAPCGGW